MMEYEEPAEIVAAEEAAMRDLMLEIGPHKAWLIAGQLARAYRAGRSRGRNEGFWGGISVATPL